MVSVSARRGGVAYARERGLSARRACTLLRVARSALSYRSRKAAADAPVAARIAELARQYPRYGYRRIRIFLGRDGHRMSIGRAYRLWRIAQLQVPRKQPRKRVANSRPRPLAPSFSNQVWSYDFVFDACADGRRIKCLTITDEFTKEGLASARVIEVLSRLVSERGAPHYRRSDNGPEFVSHALLAWIASQGISTALIEPGKPWQNGVTESFIGKFRDECLSVEWFSEQSRGEDGYRAVASRLQRSAPTLAPRLSDTGGVRRNAEGARRTVQANGLDRCSVWSLRAPTRCITASQEALAAKGEGSRLK